MKKLLCVLSLLLVCHWGYGQNVDHLFKEFRGEEHAEYVNATPILMSVVKMFLKHGKEIGIVRKMKSAKVLNLEDCSEQVRKRFNKEAGRLYQMGYEELIRINDEGDKVRVLMRTKKKAIREIVVICFGNGDCRLVQINGKFTKDDIDDLVNNRGRKKG